MPVITLFSGTFCKKDQVIEKLLSQTGYTPLFDKELALKASAVGDLAPTRIERAFAAKTSVFNKFTHEKERSITCLRVALAQALAHDNLLISGFTAQLIPQSISHVLRVCLIADMPFRVSAAAAEKALSSKNATRLIHKQDEDKAAWVAHLLNVKDPWDTTLYDLVIPMGKTGVEKAAALIEENLAKEVVKPDAASQKAVADFLLAANVEMALAGKGHHVNVDATDGSVMVTINRQALSLGKLEEELKSIAEKVSGVKSVETRVGKEFYQADIYRKFDFEMPGRVLLVDDEREFVETLSERLLMRDMGSVVAYDGESALDLVKSDEPEVMILDLQMPGINGIEVLRQVKTTNPGIEVIILTGHGSEDDRKTCMELGAFAYLHKPVDIDLLSETLKKATAKVRAATAAE